MSTARLPGSPFDGAEVLHSYSRAQAIEDGVLVSLDAATLGEDMVAQAGWKVPAAMTRAMWDSYVEVPQGVRAQDLRGRLWDILWMANMAARANRDTDRITFQWRCVTAKGRRLVEAVAVIGPGDDPAPVLTFMLPGED